MGSRISTDTEFGGLTILSGSFSANFLVGANEGQTIDVSIGNGTGFNVGGLGINGNVTTAGNASTLMAQVDSAISRIGSTRAELGAVQNRFQSTIRNLANISETAELTRNQILQQATTTILSQANQRPQAALSLLGG